ncbi:hypothetical protein [Amycolatopsis sp. CA-230715]|uniref:hypothetical protein n=1 Tax=Amycolatopsis sp. CA-230715 TaxID=2745196 RepID=UPI001C0105D5|nr:hypothetical protein [Amycolatopsis sp. CA-230715]QWF85776.1 hypothetical protein HUW46_09256 [Amycolatopsis sp. CA-230715]
MNPSAAPTIKRGVTVDLGRIERTGVLRHDDKHRSLVLLTDEGFERLSVNLDDYGLTPRPGHVFIKDFSEHAGLTERLARRGLVNPRRAYAVGMFDVIAYEVEVTF